MNSLLLALSLARLGSPNLSDLDGFITTIETESGYSVFHQWSLRKGVLKHMSQVKTPRISPLTGLNVDVSASGTEVCFTTEANGLQQLRVLSFKSRSSRVLQSFKDVHKAKFSPDARQILVFSRTSPLVIFDRQRGSVDEISEEIATADWAPDGVLTYSILRKGGRTFYARRNGKSYLLSPAKARQYLGSLVEAVAAEPQYKEGGWIVWSLRSDLAVSFHHVMQSDTEPGEVPTPASAVYRTQPMEVFTGGSRRTLTIEPLPSSPTGGWTLNGKSLWLSVSDYLTRLDLTTGKYVEYDLNLKGLIIAFRDRPVKPAASRTKSSRW